MSKLTLYDTNPNLRKEWNEEKNGSMKNYTNGLIKKVWWKCSKNNHHEWESRIDSRVKGYNCPICSNKLICPKDQCNSLYYNYNDIVKKEWNEKKNGSMKKYFPHTKKKVWWICSNKKHHEWEASISNKMIKNRGGCPMCLKHAICQVDHCNSLYHDCSDIIKREWDSDRNGSMKNYFPQTNKKVWWICSKNNEHKWKTYISHRNGPKKSGCPECSTTGYSKTAIRWMNYIAGKNNINIIHAGNGTEYKIRNSKYKADGYCKDTNTIYSFCGCIWHGCTKCRKGNDKNPFSKKLYKDLYKKTIEREKFIRSQGYNLVTIWEHEWNDIVKNNNIK